MQRVARSVVSTLVAASLIGGFAYLVLRSSTEGVGAGGDATLGETAPALTLKDFDGKSFALADYGGKPLVLNFWASWCPNCTAEMPDFERVHKQVAGAVAFLGVNLNDDRGSAEKLAGETGVTYRLAEDPDGELFRAFGAPGMPTTVFIAADGTIADVVAGQLSSEQLVGYIERSFEIDVDALEQAASGVLDPGDIQAVVPKDGIPAIDNPKFLSPSEATWLADQEPVIAIEIDGNARAYPLQIMTWHEIANDTVGGMPVVVTFCPLCNTAIAYERPTIDGEVTTFGVSGSLINSNLLMYDRATDSLWPQVTGVALVGEMKGHALERVPAPIVSWSEFRSAFPNGLVLSRDTGYDRDYGENPYPGYDDVDRPPFLFSGEVDGRLAAVERVLGVEVGDSFVAFPYFRLREVASGGLTVVNARVGTRDIVVMWKSGTRSALDRAEIATSRDVGAAAAFDRRLGGKTLVFQLAGGQIIDQTGSTWDFFGRARSGPLAGSRLRRVDAVDSFWFDWAAFHPQTRVWQANEI